MDVDFGKGLNKIPGSGKQRQHHREWINNVCFDGHDNLEHSSLALQIVVEVGTTDGKWTLWEERYRCGMFFFQCLKEFFKVD